MVPEGRFYKRRLNAVFLWVTPSVIQTWDRGRRGVAISFLPFSTNEISSHLFEPDPGLFLSQNLPQRHLFHFTLRMNFNGLGFCFFKPFLHVIEVNLWGFLYLNPFWTWNVFLNHFPLGKALLLSACINTCHLQFSLFYHKAWFVFKKYILILKNLNSALHIN